MSKSIKLPNDKTINLSSRMITPKELKGLGYDYVEGAVLFNKSNSKGKFPRIAAETRQKMAVMDYPDCLKQPFSEESLAEIIKKQISSTSDFIVLPKFKEETDYDTRRKLEMAGIIKMNSRTLKPIVLEVSYKTGLTHKELAANHSNFDILAIHYGVHYGQYPALDKIAQRIALYKKETSKPVVCIGTPLKFAGENVKDRRYMPCFDLIADLWVKHWGVAIPGSDIRLVEPSTLKSLNYQEWLEQGRRPDEIMEPVKRTVYELFQKDNKDARAVFEAYVYDELMSEIRNLTSDTIEQYIYDRFYTRYFAPIIIAYREKVIIEKFRMGDIFSSYTQNERTLLEDALRAHFSPAEIQRTISKWTDMIKADANVPLLTLVQVARQI